MSSYFVVHFQPLEKYPPVVNFIRCVAASDDYKNDLHVITTHPGINKALIDFPGVQVHRLGKWKKRSRLQRFFFYIFFNIRSFCLLVWFHPMQILYYETLSAFGPWLYRKINKYVRVFIHYHEYTSIEEYQKGMVLSRWLHKKELQLYPLSAWVSHTNAHRMNMFLRDVQAHKPVNTYLLPNYPPQSWHVRAMQAQAKADTRIGFVYVGALSMENMYTRQMADFVCRRAGDCYWDIYSDNHDSDIIDYLHALQAKNIFFKGAIPYDKLPDVLPKYDIGVILYNGNTLNYRYNAPNKLFEYLICGLNVWYPLEMETMKEFEQSKVKPWVRGIQFNEPDMPEIENWARISHIPEPTFVAEKVYIHLQEMLKK